VRLYFIPGTSSQTGANAENWPPKAEAVSSNLAGSVTFRHELGPAAGPLRCRFFNANRFVAALDLFGKFRQSEGIASPQPL
jgi:hypothetical protein